MLKKSLFALVIMTLSLGMVQIVALAQTDEDEGFNAQFTDEVTITEVTCTLQNGEQSTCYQIETIAIPESLEPGPFCPETVDDDGGIWVWDGDDPEAGLYYADGAFYELLDAMGYNFVNDDGTINIADPAQPSGNPNSGNACLEASPDETVELTILIPMTPVMANRPTDLGTVSFVGIALDGVTIFGDAPSVLDTGNLPALDHCGGHFDPGGFFHWHFQSTDIDSAFEEAQLDIQCHILQEPSALFGYAYDGFPMYGSLSQDGTVPTDLDECGGHFGPTLEYPDGIYHYHASTDSPNLPTCLVGVFAENNFTSTASFGIGAGGGQGGPPPGGDGQGGPPPGGGGQGGPPPGGGGQGGPPSDEPPPPQGGNG